VGTPHVGFIMCKARNKDFAKCEVLRAAVQAQYMTLLIYFFTSKFSYVLFCNLTRKTESGTANGNGDY